MNTLQIKRELNKYNVLVVPRNKIPLAKTFPFGIVVNTDSDKEPGEHWVSIYIDKNKTPLYFDSFGLPPLHEDIISYLENYGQWCYNTLTLQHPESNSCGWYCIEFLKNQFGQKTLTTFHNMFTSNLVRNEKILNNLRKNKNV